MFSRNPFLSRRLSLFLSAALLLALAAACSSPQAAETPTPEAPAVTPTTETVPTPVPESTPVAAPASAATPDVSGQWQGKILLPGAALEIIVALAEEDDAWAGTIDVPAQGAAGIPLHDITVDGDGIHFEMLAGQQLATFDGQVQPDGGISGAFSQMGIAGSFELARPETPTAAEPLPYLEEEVTFQNGDVTLAGTLTLPEGAGPFPALILLSGSGQQDRDEALPIVPGYKPFREIADTLTRAALRRPRRRRVHRRSRVGHQRRLRGRRRGCAGLPARPGRDRSRPDWLSGPQRGRHAGRHGRSRQP